MDITQYILMVSKSPATAKMILPKISKLSQQSSAQNNNLHYQSRKINKKNVSTSKKNSFNYNNNHGNGNSKYQTYNQSVPHKNIYSNSEVYKMNVNDIIKGNTNHNHNDHTNNQQKVSLKAFKQTLRNTCLIPNLAFKQVDSQNNLKNIGKYHIIKEIGKGGFAKVYQCSDKQGNLYAIKQYDLKNGSQCFQNQIIVGKKFFGKKEQNNSSNYKNHKGIENLIKYVDKIRIGKKGYIIQQLSGSNLSKMLSDIQGVFYNNERVYEVNFKPFYKSLFMQNKLKSIFLQLCQAVQLLNNQGFVHCDLKSQNVLVQQNSEQQKSKVKIIDFGSTFQMTEGVPKITITPQYMPPQLLNYLSSDYQNQSRLDKIDVWSLGCILLEVVTGVPLWFKYKCKITAKGRTFLQLGYFSLANRDYNKIMKRQKQLSSTGIKNLIFISDQFEKYREILKFTLQYDVNKRIGINDLVEKVRNL